MNQVQWQFPPNVVDIAVQAMLLVNKGVKRCSDIAESIGVSRSYMEAILFKLRDADLLESKRGPGGGYALAQPLIEVTVADVFKTVAVEDGCDLSPFWKDASKVIQDWCKRTYLASLV